MFFVLIQKNPSFNEDHNMLNYHAEPVLVVYDSNITDMDNFVGSLNNKCLEYRDAYRKNMTTKLYRSIMYEHLNFKPPYEEIFNVVGSKPKYDHSLVYDKEYNESHNLEVSKWRQQFRKWAENNPTKWHMRRMELANEAYPFIDIKTILGDDEFNIVNNTVVTPNNVWGDSYQNIHTPRFEYQHVRSRIL